MCRMEKIFRQVRRIKAHPGKSLCLLIIIIFLVYLILTFKTVWPFYSHSLPAIHPAGPSVVPGRDFPEKKWLHCVNSLDAARYAQSRYCGMDYAESPKSTALHNTLLLNHPIP